MIQIKYNSIKAYIINDINNKIVTLPVSKENIKSQYDLVYSLIGYNYDTVHYDKNVKYDIQLVKDSLGIFVDDFKFCNVLLEGKVVRTYIQKFCFEHDKKDCLALALEYKEQLESLGLRLW